MLKEGRPMTVEDRLGDDPLVVATIGDACVLPRDMEEHEKRYDDVMLLVSQMEDALKVSCIIFAICS